MTFHVHFLANMSVYALSVEVMLHYKAPSKDQKVIFWHLRCSLRSSMLLQGLQSPAPDVAQFSQQALLAMEGIIHPRAGHTILQPQRHSTNPHPYLSASAAELTELGMPRVWSALAPDACKPAQKPGTSTSVEASQQLQAKAASLAQEVLQAGRLCSAAAVKLQALNESRAGNGQSAEPSEHHPQQADCSTGGHDAMPAAAAASTEAALEAAAPVGSLEANRILDSDGGQDMSVPAHNVQKSVTGNHAHDRLDARPVQQPALHQVTVSGAVLANEADDGYLSLGHQSQMTGKSDAVKGLAGDKQIPETVQGSMAVAESSDSQGSLPEIDSGESSDHSSSE